MSNELELAVERIVPAPRRAVFEAWLDPAALKRFMMPGEGMSVPQAEVEDREGGSFRIVMAAGGQEIPHHGEYRTIDRHESLVTLSFEELSPRETKVVLHHKGGKDEESRRNHEGGWSAILATLAGLEPTG